MHTKNSFRDFFKKAVMLAITLWGIPCLLSAQILAPFQPGNNDPIEKDRAYVLREEFKDPRFFTGFLLYMNFFDNLDIIAVENSKTKIYRPALSRRVMLYFLNNLKEANGYIAESYFNKGLSLMDSSKYSEAMTQFDQSLAFYPENSDAYVNRGVLFIYAQQYAEALGELDKAAIYDPKNASIFFNRAVVYQNQGNGAEALKAIDGCIDLAPDYDRAYYQKGIILHALKNTDESIKALRKARALGDEDAGKLIKEYKEEAKAGK